MIYVYTPPIHLFIFSLVDGHLSCSCILVIINDVVINIHACFFFVCVCVDTYFHLGVECYIPRSGIYSVLL